MLRIAAVVLLLVAAAAEPGVTQVETGFLDRTVTLEGLRLRYQVYVPSNYSDTQEWPVILFLHGSGERGADGLRQTVVGLGPAVRADPGRFPAIVIFPQAPADSSWTGVPARAAMAALDAVLREFHTDANRVYLTGLSMGGHGVWYLAYRHPDRFAAVAPVCAWISTLPAFRGRAPVVPGEGSPFEAVARQLREVPIWIFHGELDGDVPVSESRDAAAALEAAGGDVRYTELLGTSHNAWDPTYASVAFTDWLFAQRRPR